MSTKERESENSKRKLAKKAYMLLATGAILVLGVCFLLFWVIGRTGFYIPDEERMMVRDAVFTVDKVTIERNYLTVSGWSIILGEDIVTNNTRILLHNVREDTYLLIPTEMVVRGDVTEALNDSESYPDYNYNNSGWLARVHVNRLAGELSDYRIVILYQNNDDYFTIDTEKKLETNMF
jgi:hypothetical protein